MHDAKFSHSFLFLPRLWALQHLPVGLPAGRFINVLCPSYFFAMSWFYFELFHHLPVTADFNEIPEAYVEHVSKFLPILRQREFGLGRAADYLQSLCDGTLIRLPLLDVNQFLDHFDFFPSFWWGLQSRTCSETQDSAPAFQRGSRKTGGFVFQDGWR